MSWDGQGRAGNTWFAVAIVLFLAAMIYLLVAAATGSDLSNARDDWPLVVLGLAGLISLTGWWRDRASRSAADEEARRERERLESELQERGTSLRESREQL